MMRQGKDYDTQLDFSAVSMVKVTLGLEALLLHKLLVVVAAHVWPDDLPSSHRWLFSNAQQIQLPQAPQYTLAHLSATLASCDLSSPA
jgi:hypothetical protein